MDALRPLSPPHSDKLTPLISRLSVLTLRIHELARKNSGESTPSPIDSPATPYTYITSRETTPPILAVVIGINKYISDEYPNLSGATHDADAFEEYLTTRLNVPAQNICSLRDEQASRKGIISSFIWLRDNAAYQRDECAIIFYFAGHGGQTQKPPEWDDWITPTGNIEMLCPSDIGTLTGRSGVHSQPGQQAVVTGIPDRTISVLLSQIADAKGNNIVSASQNWLDLVIERNADGWIYQTVILDCCSSAGMSRSSKKDPYTIRGISNPPPVSGRADDSLFHSGKRGGRMAVKDIQLKNAKSHVLLAACGRENFALENPKTKRGLFTHYLLKVLDKEDIRNLTYVSLMHKLKMPERQTPHCEGDGINRRLFNNWVHGGDKSMILTHRIKDKNEIILQAGSAQGITKGSRFAAYATNLIETPLQPNPCLGYFLVSHLDTFSSTLILPQDSPTVRLPLLFYCKLDRLANKRISVYSTNRTWLESVFPPTIQSSLCVTIVDTRKESDLEFAVVNGRVHIYQYNDVVAKHIGTRMRHDVDSNDVTTIRAIVKASFHFYHNLSRKPPCQFDGVHMELYRLSATMTEEFDRVFKTDGDNLLTKEPATMVVDEDVPLGVTIHNNSNRDLYPYLFYFDPSELTIAGWYLPAIGAGKNAQTTKVDAPLPARSALAIGHGDGGATPWSFLLPAGVKKDLGFFRLFLSTRPASFESILQEESPFSGISSRSMQMPVVQESFPEEGVWSVQTVTLVQVDI